MDCSKTINYLKEKARMCRAQDDNCDDCPLGGYPVLMCSAPRNPEAAVAAVQKWSDEHPQKTYAQDFLEKFPKASKNNKGLPYACRVDIYGSRFDKCCGCGDCCIDCWNKPMGGDND